MNLIGCTNVNFTLFNVMKTHVTSKQNVNIKSLTILRKLLVCNKHTNFKTPIF